MSELKFRFYVGYVLGFVSGISFLGLFFMMNDFA